MADSATSAWRPRGAVRGLAEGIPGETRSGRSPGVHVAALDGLGLASVIARRDAPADRLRDLARVLGIEPPTTPRVAWGRNADLIWSGPSQWLLVSRDPKTARTLAARLAGLAAVADQSDARAVLRLSGPNMRDALAKGCLIDLHPRAFRPGDVALTSIAHIAVQLWAVDDATFDLAVPRSLVMSFWSWLRASAAQYGIAVAAPASERRAREAE